MGTYHLIDFEFNGDPEPPAPALEPARQANLVG